MRKLVSRLGASAILLVAGLTSGATVDQSLWDSSIEVEVASEIIGL